MKSHLKDFQRKAQESGEHVFVRNQLAFVPLVVLHSMWAIRLKAPLAFSYLEGTTGYNM